MDGRIHFLYMFLSGITEITNQSFQCSIQHTLDKNAAKCYIGKTDRCFQLRLNEHGQEINFAMHQHLNQCEAF